MSVSWLWVNLAKHFHMLGAWNLKLVTFSSNGNFRSNDKINKNQTMSQKESFPSFQSKCVPNLHQTVTAWPTLAWGTTFPTNAELLEIKTSFSAKGENAWIWKGTKRNCTRERRQEWKTSSQSISVNKHVESLLLEYAASHGNCCIFFCLNSFLASRSLVSWTDLVRGGGYFIQK